ncbi:MAG: AraC family transcriptional regulator [bacterium]|nr:AraC family transcriptional regulator [bacterium]
MGWEAEYIQLDAGPLESRFRIREYDDFLVAKETYNTRLEISCAPPAGMVAVILTSPGDRSAEANGLSLGDCGIQVIWPGGDTRITFFRPDETHVVHFEAQAFAEASRQMHPGKTLIESGIHQFKCSPCQALRLRNYMDQLVYYPAGRHSSLERLDTLRSMILGIALDCNDQLTSGTSSSRLTHLHIASNARDFIETNYDTPITAGMLCQVTGTGLRTLQRAFEEHFELTPSQYLKLRRLNAVHLELMQCHDREITVTEIALRHGFGHLGRFSQSYRSLFRETPKSTLCASRRV